jgi:hypothetical protein
MNLEELQYDICEGCGERTPEGQGIIAWVMHQCPLNTVIYRGPGKFGMRHLREMFGDRRALQSFYDLLHFPYFKAMPFFEMADTLEKKSYYWAREAEIKQMKRLRSYVELEEELNMKW